MTLATGCREICTRLRSQLAKYALVMAHYILVTFRQEREVHGPPWCNGSTPAFGAVEYRFESYGRNNIERICQVARAGTMELFPIAYV